MYISAQLAAIGGVKESESVETAGINSDELLINPIFYKSLNSIERLLLVDHEILHLVFHHHTRFENSLLTNYCADLAINGILYRKYVGSEDPNIIIPTLWKIGVFPQKDNLPELMTTDWYIEVLKSREIYKYAYTPLYQGFGGRIGEGAALEEKLNGLEGGLGDLQKQVRKEFEYSKNRSFDKLVKDLAGCGTISSGYGQIERYGYNRRQPDSLIPYCGYGEGNVKIRKNNIILLLDYSSSCESLIPIFEKAVSQISKQFFNTDCYLFADYIHKSPNNVGSGTNYNDFDNFVSKYSYDMVWVFTDGYGSKCKLSHPNKWHWFLKGESISSTTIDFIPKDSHIHFLDHFVL